MKDEETAAHGIFIRKKKKETPPEKREAPCEIAYYHEVEAVIWGSPARITFMRSQKTYENVFAEYTPNVRGYGQSPEVRERIRGNLIAKFNEKVKDAVNFPLEVAADEPEKLPSGSDYKYKVRIRNVFRTADNMQLCQIKKDGAYCRYRKIDSAPKQWFDIRSSCFSEEILSWGAVYLWVTGGSGEIFWLKASEADRKRALSDEPEPWEPEKEPAASYEENFCYYDDNEAIIWGMPRRITFFRSQKTYENIRAEYVPSGEVRHSADDFRRDLENTDIFPMLVRADPPTKTADGQPFAYDVIVRAFETPANLSSTDRSYGLCRVVKDVQGCRFYAIDDKNGQWRELNAKCVSKDMLTWGAVYMWYTKSSEWFAYDLGGKPDGEEYYLLKASPAERERALAAPQQLLHINTPDVMVAEPAREFVYDNGTVRRETIDPKMIVYPQGKPALGTPITILYGWDDEACDLVYKIVPRKD